MIAVINSLGGLVSLQDEDLFQGSTKLNKIDLVAPFADNVIWKANFEMPDGSIKPEDLDGYLFQPSMKIIDNLNVWKLPITFPVTQDYGVVVMQLRGYIGDTVVCTTSIKLPIQKGVPYSSNFEELSDKDQLLQMISDLKALTNNKVDKVNYTFNKIDNITSSSVGIYFKYDDINEQYVSATLPQEYEENTEYYEEISTSRVVNSDDRLYLEYVDNTSGQSTKLEVLKDKVTINDKQVATIEDLTGSIEDLKNTNAFKFAQKEYNKVKNLINIKEMLNECLIDNGDGTYTLTKLSTNRYSEYANIHIPANTEFTVSSKVLDFSSSENYIRFEFGNGGGIFEPFGINAKTYKYSYDIVKACIYIGSNIEDNRYIKFKDFQIELGNIATEYTEYIGNIVHEKELNQLENKLNSKIETKVDNTTNNLINYYLKSETYTKDEVNNLISAINSFGKEIVNVLPTENISESKIYLVPVQGAEGNNYYEEYLYVNGRWELIGTTQISLDDYYDKTSIDNLLLTTHKQIILGADGVLEGDVYNFTVESPDSYINYRTNGTKFLVDLHLPVVGEIDTTKEVAITFGDTVYYVYNILKGAQRVTIGDLRQVNKYSNATGYRFIVEMTFFENADITGFAIIPTVSISDVLSLTSDEMDNYMAEGGLTQGQLAICKKVSVNGYTEGGLYRFDITYPDTYVWTELIGGCVAKEEFEKLLNNEVQIVNPNNDTLLLLGGAKPYMTSSKSGIGIGKNVYVHNANSVGIGYSAYGTGAGAIAVGGYSKAMGEKTISLGHNAVIDTIYVTKAVQLGAGKNTQSNTLQIFDDNIYNHNTHTLTVQNIELNGVNLGTQLGDLNTALEAILGV